MSGDNIWNLAVQHVKQSEKENIKTKDSMMLVVGSKNGGKTSICNKFVEKTDTPKPTLALEYTFGRRSRSIDMDKDVCHIWELGGGTVFIDLLAIPVTPKSLLSLSIILVLDLSLPEELWFTMETLLNAIRKQVHLVLQRSSNLTELLQNQIKERIKDMEEVLDPFPLPLLILGTKYDSFQDIESEKRKLICKCLRYIALMNGGVLQFLSNRSENQMTKTRVTISNMVFGTSPNKGSCLDYNKQLYVPLGTDSMEQIGGLPDPHNPTLSIAIESLDSVKNCFTSFFPQVESKNVVPDDPGSDPHFRERDIDIMRSEKDRELQEYQKQKSQKQPIWEYQNT